jgi:hypothetical protein
MEDRSCGGITCTFFLTAAQNVQVTRPEPAIVFFCGVRSAARLLIWEHLGRFA